MYVQFRGDFTPKTKLTMVAARAGLVMDPARRSPTTASRSAGWPASPRSSVDGKPAAKFTLDVDPEYVDLIPVNVDAKIKATTVFGNKYVSLTSPKDPAPQRSRRRRDRRKVGDDGVQHLVRDHGRAVRAGRSGQAEPDAERGRAGADGLGDKFGQSIVNGNEILDDLNPRMPQIRHDIQQLAALGDIYADAAPDLFDVLDNAVTTARTLNQQQNELDQALLAAIGFANTGDDIFTRSGPYLERRTADLMPTAHLLDTYSPELFCTIRNFARRRAQGRRSRERQRLSLRNRGRQSWAPSNPYVYPDNLPRVNARGGPGGKPGCWQPITRDLWPAPYLVMDTGDIIAPYNHFGLGQPLAIEYVWGRQIGENTINP